jgi:branched-chain amino acid transport system ATP-binding protein
MALIEIKDLVIDYGIVRAVKGINLKIEKGTIVALLGANGAGKSSTIRSISGAVKVKSGEILFDGKNIANMDTHKIAELGLKQSPEGRMIFAGLTVEENLLAGAYTVKKQEIPALLEEVFGYFPILKQRRKQQASTLSGGEQQMLAIGRALMGNPEVLLLDEPSLGLAPLIVKDIFNIINQIKQRGKTILIVEQNALQTLKIADYAYILELGKIVSEGNGQVLLNDDKLINAYLG